MAAVMLCAGSTDKARILWLSWVYSLVESTALCVVIWSERMAWTDTLFLGDALWVDAVLIFATVGATLKWLLLPTAVNIGWKLLLRGGGFEKSLAGWNKERSGDVIQLLNLERFN